MRSHAAILAIALSVTCAALPAQAQSIGGRYVVQGENMNGSAYRGTADIQMTSPNTCRITWVTGSSTSQGICMVHGSSFSAAYSLQGKIGLVSYEIRPDGAIEGVWTVADAPGVGKERLIPAR